MTKVTYLLATLFLTANLFASEPIKDGLVLWLDAADSNTISTNANGKVSGWKDRTNGKQGAVRGEVRRVAKGMNGRDVMRFHGEKTPSGIDFPAWHESDSAISLFIVWQRTPKQASDKQWQRLIACEKSDRSQGFCITGKMRGGGGVVAPVLYTVSHVTAPPLPFTVGLANAPSTGNPLRGDVAEILVYNRRFADANEFHAIEQYLIDKWGCQPDLNSQGWLRPSNTLPAVKHENTQLPLHDQMNAGKWQPFAPWSDEFNTDTLNTNQWYNYNPNWHGRAPARYLPKNVSVKEGAMGITMSRDAPKEPITLYGEGSEPYHTYTASSVVSKDARTYGSFEIRCRAMPSYATSAWWFIGHSTNAAGEMYINEIDVFEIGGWVPGEEARCGGNLHVKKIAGEETKIANPAGWIAPFRFADDYHTFGLDWGPEYIRWYLDGTLYRSSRNTHWHTPLRMLFDTEIWSWWPDPIPEHFPSTFHVDYVRAWSHADWKEPTDIQIRPVSNAITKRLRTEKHLP